VNRKTIFFRRTLKNHYKIVPVWLVAVSELSKVAKTTTFSGEPTFHSLKCNGIRRVEMEEPVVPEELFLPDYSMFCTESYNCNKAS